MTTTVGSKIFETIDSVCSSIENANTLVESIADKWSFVNRLDTSNAIMRLRQTHFTVAFVGIWNGGKTTGLQATSAAKMLIEEGVESAVGDLPTTPCPLLVTFGEAPAAYIERKGTRAQIPLETLRHIDIASPFYSDVDFVIVVLPEPALKSLSFVDTSGLLEDAERTRRTRDAVLDVDVVIVVSRVSEFGGEVSTAEVDAVNAVIANKPALFLMNQIDGASLEPSRFSEYWSAFVTGRGGAEYGEQPLTEGGIYEVDLAKALEGRRLGLRGDPRGPSLLAQSGFDSFEAELFRLIREAGFSLKVRAWVSPVASSMGLLISDLRHQLQQLLRELAQHEERCAAIEHELEHLEKDKAAMMATIIETRETLVDKIRESWAELFGVLKDDVDRAVGERQLESLSDFGRALRTIWNKKPVQEEIARIVHKAITTGIAEWAQGKNEAYTATSVIKSVIDPAVERIARRVVEVLSRVSSFVEAQSDATAAQFQNWAEYRDLLFARQSIAINELVEREVDAAVSTLAYGAGGVAAVLGFGIAIDAGLITIPIALIVAITSLVNFNRVREKIVRKAINTLRDQLDELRDSMWPVVEVNVRRIHDALVAGTASFVEAEFFAPQRAILTAEQERAQHELDTVTLRITAALTDLKKLEDVRDALDHSLMADAEYATC